MAKRGRHSSTAEDPLTDKQKQVFDHLLSFAVEHLYQPSLRELCKTFEVKSCNGMLAHIRALQKKGWVDLGDRVTGRSIRILRLPKTPVVLGTPGITSETP